MWLMVTFYKPRIYSIICGGSLQRIVCDLLLSRRRAHPTKIIPNCYNNNFFRNFNYKKILILHFSCCRFGSKINDQKNGDWSSWRAWVAAHSLAVPERCEAFQWICRRVALTMARLVFRILPTESSSSATVGHRFIRTTAPSFPDTLVARCHSTYQVKELYVCIRTATIFV